MRLVAIGIAYGGKKHTLQERFGQQFSHVLWARIAKVSDLVAAACARGDDFSCWWLTINRIEQALSDLN